jgi:ubiquinone/menaquinone biosynthesis C-methylase UbiE
MGILNKFYGSANEDCIESIIKLLDENKKSKYLDLGCWDGKNTLKFNSKIKTKNISGIEITKEGKKKSKAKRIKIAGSDLNKKWGFKDNSIDIITANQVIEHLYDTDNFIKEIKRILKPNGYAVVSTNNLSSWHNLVALLLGRQPFPSDVSNDSSVGKLIKLFPGDGGSFAHLRIFSFKALKEIFEKYGFKIEKHIGVGYYPLPKYLDKLFGFIDPWHTVYQTIKVRKVK